MVTLGKQKCRGAMNPSHPIEPILTDHFSNNLIRAIDEAMLVRSIINSREMVKFLRQDNPFSDRIIHHKRKIRKFETKLAQIRSLSISK